MVEGFDSFFPGVTRLAVLGVGSELRSDDASGLVTARFLQRRCRDNPNLYIAEGGSAPENLSGPIAVFNPSHLVVVDSADMGLDPGSIRLVNVDNIGGFSASTHCLPLAVLIQYLLLRISCRVALVGIQPENLDFDGRISHTVCRAAYRLAREIEYVSNTMMKSIGEDRRR
jgi:hydrogenase 3 maturation protease